MRATRKFILLSVLRAISSITLWGYIFYNLNNTSRLIVAGILLFIIALSSFIKDTAIVIEQNLEQILKELKKNIDDK
jgi:hypothetical protein